MRRYLIVPLALIAFGLAGCGTISNIGGLVSVATTTIDNPVTPTNIYQVRLTFDLIVKASNKWADYCWSGSYAQLMTDPVASVVCKNRRTTRRTLSAAGDRTEAAIEMAETFIRNNPTLSPLKAINDAWGAVQSYKAKVAAVQPLN